MTSDADPCVCPLVKSTGKPDAGNPHVRFDEGEGYALPTLLANPFLLTFQELLLQSILPKHMEYAFVL